MHKLNRPSAPTCLSNYQHGANNWSNVTGEDKKEIWQKLDVMQGKRCAYCEDALQESGRHIEHFEQRSRKPQFSFAWSNLFGSCNKEYSCGKHKDRQNYNPNDIIKPDVDDPDDYLRFLSNGRIVPRDGLTPVDLNKAKETLRVFNLDHDRGPLRFMRKSHVAGYIQTAEEFGQIAGTFSEAEWRPLLNEELKNVAHLPFATAIRHVLTEFLP